MNTSYLNPRGPEIVSRTPTHIHVPDTREGINIDLQSIAELNGVEFVGKPTTPTADQINRGTNWLNDGWPFPPCHRIPGEDKGFVLEYGVYAAFSKALTNRGRNYWQLYRGMKGKRVSRPGRRGDPNPLSLMLLPYWDIRLFLLHVLLAMIPQILN